MTKKKQLEIGQIEKWVRLLLIDYLIRLQDYGLYPSTDFRSMSIDDIMSFSREQKEAHDIDLLLNIITNDIRHSIRLILMIINNQDILIDNGSFVAKVFLEELNRFAIKLEHIKIETINVDAPLSFIEENTETLLSIADYGYNIVYP